MDATPTKTIRNSMNYSLLMCFIDLGASHHKTPELSLFSKLEYTEPFSVEMGDKVKVTAEGCGDVELSISMLGNRTKLFIQCVLYVPDLQFILISRETIRRRGVHSTVTKHGPSIPKNGNLYPYGKVLGELYILDSFLQQIKT